MGASIVVVIAIIASWSFVIPLSSNGVYVDSDNVHNFTVGDEYEIMENQRVLIEEKEIKRLIQSYELKDIEIERQRALLEEKDVEIKRLFQSYEVNKTAIESFSVPDKHQGNTWGFYFFFYFYMFCIVWMVCKCLGTNALVKNGKWKCTYANGDVYDGDFKDGNFHGKGTYTWANGNVYVGEWKDDKKHGKATYTVNSGWNKGDVYVGEYKDDKRNGYGKFTNADGSIWHDGRWKDGLP